MPLQFEQECAAIERAIRNPREIPPKSLYVWHGGRVSKRFAVLRNGYFSGWIDALAATFPVCKRLVGADFFSAMAKRYIQFEPPATPVVADYGETFAAFLSDFEPVRELPYLTDVAELEWAISRAYHAADAMSLELESARSIPTQLWAQVTIFLHPSARLVTSSYPILDIWTTNAFDEDVRNVNLDRGGQDILIARPRLEVFAHPLPGRAFSQISRLALGETFSNVFEMRPESEASECLRILLSSGAIKSVDFNSADHGSSRL